MKAKKKIDPAKTTPQAPRSLRVGTKGHARAEAAKAQGKAPPDPEDDDDDDPDEEDDAEDKAARQAAHDSSADSAAASYRAAAAAAEATKGSDSAGALQAGEDAHDAAMETGAAFQTSCRSMRGVAADADAPAPSDRPGAPPAPMARSSTPVATAAAHIELAALAKLGRDVLVRTGKPDAASALAAVEAGALALADVKKLRVDAKAHAVASHATLVEKRLRAACADGTFSARTQAFVVTEETKLVGGQSVTVEVLTPKPVWLALSAEALEEQLLALGDGRPLRPGAQVPGPDATRDVALGQHGDIKARADADGVSPEIRAQAEQHVASAVARARQPSAQEP